MGLILVFPLLMLVGVVFVGLALFGLLLRVALRVLLLPLLLVKWIVMGIVMLIIGPILLVVGVGLFLVTGVALAVPFLPLLAIAAILWLVFAKANRRPAVV
jgi:hypothetical protein